MTVIDVTTLDLEALVANLHPDQRDELRDILNSERWDPAPAGFWNYPPRRWP